MDQTSSSTTTQLLGSQRAQYFILLNALRCCMPRVLFAIGSQTYVSNWTSYMSSWCFSGRSLEDYMFLSEFFLIFLPSFSLPVGVKISVLVKLAIHCLLSSYLNLISLSTRAFRAYYWTWLACHCFYSLALQNFGFDGKLVVNYACSMAWGWELLVVRTTLFQITIPSNYI